MSDPLREISDEELRATADQAVMLLQNRLLNETLDELLSTHTQNAIFGATPEVREESRNLVLGVNAFRQALIAAFEAHQARATDETRARSME